MGDDVAARRSFITRKAKDVRFLDVKQNELPFAPHSYLWGAKLIV